MSPTIDIKSPSLTFDLSIDEQRYAFFDLFKEPTIEMPFDLTTDKEFQLLRHLGMPVSHTGIRIHYPGSHWQKDYKNFLVEIVGVRLDELTDTDLRSPAWGEWDEPDGSKIPINVWRQLVWERHSRLAIHSIWNPSKDMNSLLSLALGGIGWVTRIGRINSVNPDLEKEVESVKRLARGIFIMRKAVESPKVGPPPLAIPDPDTLLLWISQHAKANTAIKAEMERRTYKQWAKCPEQEKPFILTRALPDTPKDIIQALTKLSRLADIVLEYTGWYCSQIPVGTWGPDRYRDYLQESEKLNQIKNKK